jgi:hypothetical protein
MIQLTEKIVVKIALAYLKRHYKYMPREGETQVRSDVRTEEGIRADGYLAFRVDDAGKVFTATIEATDYMKRKELRYSLYRQLMFMDGLTLAMALMALLSGWAHIRGAPSVYPTGPEWAILTILGGIAILTLLVILLVRGRSRYHYIYAVEQFKQYHADDQWVAFAWDVFHSTESKYYRELRKQCMQYGFGLLEVDREQHVKIHLAPTRMDVFGRRRAIRQFRQVRDFTQRIGKRLTPRLPLPVKVNPRLRIGDWSNLFRFRRSYRHQAFISGISLALIIIFFSLELRERPIVYEDTSQDQRRRERLAQRLEGGADAESRVFLVDTAAVPPPMPNVRPYLLIDQAVPGAIPQANTSREGDVFLYGDDTFQAVPCDRLTASANNRYLVYLNSYYDPAYAKSQALYLRRRGIPVNVIWADCFFPGRTFYILYLEDLYDTFEEGQRARQRLDRELLNQTLDFETNIGRINNT